MWFEFVGALSNNLHRVSQIIAVVSTILSVCGFIRAFASMEEYNEIEFVDVGKSFGKLAVGLWLLSCAPTPQMMKEFVDGVNAANTHVVSIDQPPKLQKAIPGDTK
jgi:hypothetical protein